jgi:hypothetical protein
MFKLSVKPLSSFFQMDIYNLFNENQVTNEKYKLLDKDTSTIISSFVNKIHYKINDKLKIENKLLCAIYDNKINDFININIVEEALIEYEKYHDYNITLFSLIVNNPFIKDKIIKLAYKSDFLNKRYSKQFLRNCEYIEILEYYKDNLEWEYLCCLKNKNIINFIKKYINEVSDKLEWNDLSANKYAIDILINNQNKINWTTICFNENAGELILQNEHMIDNDSIDWTIISGHQSNINLLRNNLNKLEWNVLSLNEHAIPILQENTEFINWDNLSKNPNAIDLLKSNLNKVNWDNLSFNENAIDILSENIDRINWNNLLFNKNKNAFELLLNNKDKINHIDLLYNDNLDLISFNKIFNKIVILKKYIVINKNISNIIFIKDDDSIKKNNKIITNLIHNKISFK